MNEIQRYRDASLPLKERAEDLLQRMTLEQKIAQLQCTMTVGAELDAAKLPYGVGVANVSVFGLTKEQMRKAFLRSANAAAENSCGVPPMLHTEALNGLTATAETTIFPSPIGLGASFDPAIVGKAARIIHRQTRAMGYHQALAPVLDVCRDPRWGRVGETYGEDPTLNAMIGTAYVKGLQGEDGDKIAATGKHFLGYGLSAGGLNMASCVSADSEIREVHAKPFQAAMSEGGMLSVMNSYGTIDGEMVVGSEKILTRLLREEMEFDGPVVSDYTSIEHLVDYRLAEDMIDAGRQALRAGLDVECPFPRGYSTENLLAGLKSGEIPMEWIDRSVKRVLTLKLRLGMLDKEAESVDFSCFSDPANQKVALQVGRESIVLLKNNGILPLDKEKKRIAVIGPHADSVRLLFGCYTYAAGLDMMIGGSLADQAGMATDLDALAEASMSVKKNVPTFPGSTVERENEAALAAVAAAYPRVKTVLAALREKAPDIDFSYVRGCDYAGQDRSGFADALAMAGSSDAVIVTVGGKYGWGGSCTVGEGIDTDDIGLTGVQEELILSLCETGKPVIVVHMDARPLCCPRIAEKADAILELWYPGVIGGEALAEVLFGEYNPAGRLPITAPRSAGQIPIYAGQYTGNSYYSNLASAACRYVDSTTLPLYPFGYGLSYTQFSYRDLEMDQKEVPSDGCIRISCKVKNTGAVDGEEVVQLYVSDLVASKLRPFQEFAGCARVFLKAGEEKIVRFTLRADQLAFVGKDGRWLVEAGEIAVQIGPSSINLPLQGQFRIADTALIRPAKRGFYARADVLSYD